ncbi:hypothetical protein ES705_30547 [subsurface metagenome]
MLAVEERHKIDLPMSREQVINTTLHYLIEAGVLLTSETNRYRKVLESYDNFQVVMCLLYSRCLKELHDDTQHF